jgi:hypothetical protein
MDQRFGGRGLNVRGTIAIRPDRRHVETIAFPDGIVGEVRVPRTVTTLCRLWGEGEDQLPFFRQDWVFEADCEKLWVSFEEGSMLYSILESTFGYSKLRSICIPNTCVRIGWRSFYRSIYLEEVTFEEPSSLRIIGDQAFTGTRLKSIRIPSSVRSLGMCCFENCHYIEAVSFEEPSGLEKIGSNCFAKTWMAVRIVDAHPFTKFYMPNSVKSIEHSCFLNADNLHEIIFEPGTQLVEIPEIMFKESGLQQIVIPRSVQTIAQCAFSMCIYLKYIAFEEGSLCTHIGRRAFEKGVQHIQLPASVTDLEAGALFDLREIGFDSNEFFRVETVEPIAGDPPPPPGFWYSDPKPSYDGFSAVYSPDCTILIQAMERSRVTTLKIPDGILHLADECFMEFRNLRTISLNAGLHVIGRNAFTKCGLRSIVIPRSVEVLEAYCFNDCDLTQVTFENDSQLKRIGNWAFDSVRAAHIEYIDIPKRVEFIAPTAFRRVTSLTVDPSNKHYTSDDRFIYQENVIVCCYCPYDIRGRIIIPAFVEGGIPGCLCGYSARQFALENKRTRLGIEPLDVRDPRYRKLFERVTD